MTGSGERAEKPIVIFGAGSLASLARHVLAMDAEREVAGFTVDRGCWTGHRLEGLPVVPFEELEESYPPNAFDLLISVGWHRINALRRERFEDAKRRGYRCASHVSRHAVIWPDLEIPENTIIHEGVVIQSHARLGANVILRTGANIGHHGVVGSHSFIASGVVTGGCVRIGEQVFLGLGAVLRDGLKIAERTLVGAGAVVLADTEADGVYVGNPARKLAKTALEASGAAS